jgi:signal transduction histidine kinase
MDALSWVALISDMTTAVACSAIALLLLLQLSRDETGRALARMVAALAGLTFLSVLWRISALSGENNQDLFTLLVVLTGALPCCLFAFAVTYTGEPRRYRWISWPLIVLFVYCAVSGLAEITLHVPALIKTVTLTPDGLILWDFGPLMPVYVAAFLLGQFGVLMAVGVVFRHYRKQRASVNARVVAGVSLLALGVFIVPIPGIEQYAFEQLCYTLGAVILASAVLRENLFEPLTQLNRKLLRRNDQLSAITRVGQTAALHLNLEHLLDVLGKEIQAAFGYEAVLLHLVDDKGTHWRDGSPVTEDSLAGMAALSRKLQYRGDLPQARSEVSIPLLNGVPNDLGNLILGVLDIVSSRARAFDEADLEVLQILGRQIAGAIRNARLFEQSQQARQEADAASETKSRFVSYVSHEIRNGLTPLVNRTQTILDYPQLYGDMALPEAYRIALEEMQRGTQYMYQLMNDILDLSKMEAGKLDLVRRRLDPAPVFQEVRQAVESLLYEGVILQAGYTAPLPAVYADERRLKQILLNMLSNACKVTRQGRIMLDAQAESAVLRIVVADTGPGIPAEDLPRLFTPYAQVDGQSTAPQNGTGLGLSIAKYLVELHEGQIGVESTPGQGATFFFTLPLAP